MSYTKKQHYLSRYVLKRFTNDKCKIDAVLVNSTKRIVVNINDICVENDFYEDKSRDGQYIDRNRTENKFADMESELASKIEYLFGILNDENCKDRLRNMYLTEEWESLSVYLMFHLTLVMIRNPKLKEIVFNKDKLPLEMKQLFYKELLFGKKEAKVLALKQFQDSELDIILKLLENKADFDGGVNELMNYLINNYFVEVYKVPIEKKFFLSDDPIIVNEIEGIDYFMPLSSDVAIAMKRIPNSGQCNIEILPTVSEKMVDGINKIIIKNATRVIIVQNMTMQEFEFIRENLNRDIKDK